MCAIFGILNYKGIVSNKVMNKITQALANASEERGTDASGIAYVKDGDVKIYKRPKPAHKLKFKVPEGTKVVMGHTRFATQGNKKDNFNNHPFRGFAKKGFALAHNGVITNDLNLGLQYSLPHTEIVTDSYVAVQLIEHFGELSNDSLEFVANNLRGTFNLTVLDESNNLYLVKGSNPLTILDFESLGLIVYASTDSILKKAMAKTILQHFKNEEIGIHEGEIFKFDSNAKLTSSRYEVKEYFSPKYYDYDWFDYPNQTSEDAPLDDFLFSYARMFGYEDYEIEELLEYGYTADEIEDLLYDEEEMKYVLSYIRGIEYDKRTSRIDYEQY